MSDAGRYRNHGVRILGVHVPTANYLKIPVLMPELVRNINRPVKDVIAHTSLIHSRFEQIHPFADGNGRIGQIIDARHASKSQFAALSYQARAQAAV